MARNLANISTTTITLLLIAIFQILLIITEARPMIKTQQSVNSPTQNPSPPAPETEVSSSGFGDSDAKAKDDFRPTAPGFSPGVGHKATNGEDALHRKAAGTGVAKPVLSSAKNTSTGHSLTSYTSDFRRTGAGHSPGVGHKSQTTNAAAAADRSHEKNN